MESTALWVSIGLLVVGGLAAWSAFSSSRQDKRSADAAERAMRAAERNAAATSYSTKLQKSDLEAKSQPLLAYRSAKNVDGGREVRISNEGAQVRGVEVKPLGGYFSVSLNINDVLKAGDERGKLKFLWKNEGLFSEPLRFIFQFTDRHDSQRSQVYECDLLAGTLRLVGEAEG